MRMSDSIAIAEDFYSIQGEGPYAGTPAIFLRLQGCNLVCGGRDNLHRDPEEMEPEGDASWVCDTIATWREAQRHENPAEIIERWEQAGWLESLENGAHLVLTGGEPMMEHNQEAFLSLYTEFIERDIYPFVEVETNGTIHPREQITPYIDQWNVSLKLENSGMEREERINEDALLYFKVTHEKSDEGDRFDKDATLKFVVGSEPDIYEIEDILSLHNIPDSMVSLMPAGQTQEQLRETYPLVAEICKNKGWQFSPRLHVDAWNQATGV